MFEACSRRNCFPLVTVYQFDTRPFLRLRCRYFNATLDPLGAVCRPRYAAPNFVKSQPPVTGSRCPRPRSEDSDPPGGWLSISIFTGLARRPQRKCQIPCLKPIRDSYEGGKNGTKLVQSRAIRAVCRAFGSVSHRLLVFSSKFSRPLL